jgi:pimeloyl-ACP methyl ester carboxylesterase
MSNFYIQRNIPQNGKKTYVNWAKEPAYKAVVFIHGFNGSSLETFGSFNDDFRNRPEYIGRDVYFFGYDSLFEQIANSALEFLDFLRCIHNNLPEVVIDSGINIIRNREYTEIVIICHSLGAVVTRVALNEGYASSGGDFLHKCKLILFAPAHQGAQKVFSSLSFPSYLAVLGPLMHYFVVTLDQLTERDIIIDDMETKCAELIDQGIDSFTIAKKVIWASPERVVINSRFLKDPEAVRYKGKKISHTKVCKPSVRFQAPLIEVEQVLNASI